MSTQRYISTSFWTDKWILNLPVGQKQQKPKEYCVEKIMRYPVKFYRFIGA